ncbi:MAG: hypothetical protein LBQ97_04430 [Fusobacteriaceae bacterium]|jgi:hypothetical protein|nr:hypothetical protein [Fusobacteriaceae bacterium]
MAIKREFGKEQPFIPAGIFKIRLPLLHFKWEWSECIQAIIMCATCLGAIPILESVLEIPYDIAWSMVIINGAGYMLHYVLGDPVVPGWITPAIPLVSAFLMKAGVAGPERNRYLIALQLEVSGAFLIMGVTGLAKKVIKWIPSSLKAGILLGAGMSAVLGEFSATGRFLKYPVTLTVGVIIAFYVLFSARFQYMKQQSKFCKIIGNFGMLPALIVAIIIGPIMKELPPPGLVLGSIVKIPDFSGIIQTLSPLGPTGFPGAVNFAKAFPVAIMVYIIAFGDFVSTDAMIGRAEISRDDEHIDLNANRSNIICFLRNGIQAIICPYVPLCGPLWAAVTASVSERYRTTGREGMDSIFSGVGTFRTMTFISVALYPIAEFVRPILPAALALTMIVQGYVCGDIAMEEAKTPVERGVATVMAGILIQQGAGWGLLAGVVLHLLCGAGKIAKRKERVDEE